MRPRLLLVAAVLALVACNDAAPSETAQESAPQPLTAVPTAELRALLRAPDVVLDRDNLLALGSPAALVTAFEQLLDDPTCSIYERTRILSAMRRIEEPRIAPLLHGVLVDPTRSDFERRVAVKSYAQVAGPRAVDALDDLAAHPDRHTREAVLRALQRIDSAGARAVLQRRASQETEPDLKQLALRGG